MRFGRKKPDSEPGGPVDPAAGDAAGTPEEAAPEGSAPLPPRTRDVPESGPYDVAEVDLEERELVDLGSILMPPPQGMELRLQVDERTQTVVAVLLVGDDGALELRAFAASRGGGAWDELRPRIASETTRLGGQVKEVQGTFGTEVVCLVPVKGPEGQQATQASRVSGHEGPTWMLRANLMGNPAIKPEQAGRWEEIVRSVVVRRGPGAMAPGSAPPLRLPPDARRTGEA